MIERSIKNKKNSKIKALILLLIVFTSIYLTGCATSNNGNNQSNNQDSLSSSISSDKNVKIHFINTGNSDAILIQDGKTFTLIDGGDNDDENLMVDYLNNQGVKDIKYLIATHSHADHLGGLDSVVKNFNIENVFVSNGSAETKSYRDFINALANKDLSPSVPLENNKFYLEDSYFEVLNTNGGDTTNEQSLVLVYTNGNDKVLFTGDAEEGTEKEILPKLGKVDLLKVAHHGSRSSSSQEFLNKVDPEYAVLLVGKGNSYGHPHQETMNKLEKMGVKVHRSDECSDIIFESTGDGVFTSCEDGSYNKGVREDGNYGKSNNNTIKNESSNKEQNVLNSAEVVYFTPKGKSYHSTKNCSGLSRSKKILSGTIAESKKNDPCDICYGK
ncbi:MBL fold metallo-hydrolase [Clostridioides sp. ES-S-0108-01]|uniref:ComEC/Rec2 family competence protein n=1 Tax=Clostridioides sp. ES-S-0108-01 TaxID=2770773 RepID=UPI001D0BFD8C|nr:MBL fold metallo-hydrolase [Clostridioides sp. ES-S-0108-01]UDN49662.1 MBL fold metallo-hydrolase [Clostridioides sp. ES-S-0107-01]